MTRHFKSINPTSADNISEGYALEDIWINTVTYDRYEHTEDGVWTWLREYDDVMIQGIDCAQTTNIP